MIGVRDFINLVLQKQNLSRADLVRKLNNLEQYLGEARTTKQNVTNFLNGQLNYSPITLIKYEVVLKLPKGSLIKMCKPLTGKEDIKRFKEMEKKVGKYYGNNF